MTVIITNKETDGVSVVALDGRIVMGEESNSLRERVKTLIGEGKKKIVLNMANVKYIDSAGLGILVAAHVSAPRIRAQRCICPIWEISSTMCCN